MGCIKLIGAIIFWPITLPLAILGFALSIVRSVLFFALRLIGIDVVDTTPPSPLVYVSHKFHKNGDENGVLLEIEGRQKGFIAFIMRILGISNQSFVRVTKSEVRVSSKAPLSNETLIAPLNNITTTTLELRKPAKWAYFGAFIIVAMVYVLFSSPDLFILMGMAIAAIVCFLVYYLSSVVHVAFSTGGANELRGVLFENGGLGGQSGNRIQYTELMEMFEYIDRNVVKAHK
ncbi:MAG: hypothetical protein AAFR81_22470 [Chloroflexota bacterium]